MVSREIEEMDSFAVMARTGSASIVLNAFQVRQLSLEPGQLKSHEDGDHTGDDEDDAGDGYSIVHVFSFFQTVLVPL